MLGCLALPPDEFFLTADIQLVLSEVSLLVLDKPLAVLGKLLDALQAQVVDVYSVDSYPIHKTKYAERGLTLP